ncbi:copper chaperone PCu(A)C [Acetobacteraceae bacterium H6797]|nr:copper chaperone PCu(A)C [Acetobacteraceae bacterium H6797]
MHRRLLLATLAAAAASPRLAAAHAFTLGQIEIGHPWSRAAIAGSTGAGFMTLTNKGTTPDKLIGGRAEIARKVELHTHLNENGVMKMREVEGGIPLPPGEMVELKPGGFHMMLIGLKTPLAVGAKVPVTLVFEKAGEITVELAVERPGAQAAGHGNATGGHSTH